MRLTSLEARFRGSSPPDAQKLQLNSLATDFSQLKVSGQPSQVDLSISSDSCCVRKLCQVTRASCMEDIVLVSWSDRCDLLCSAFCSIFDRCDLEIVFCWSAKSACDLGIKFLIAVIYNVHCGNCDLLRSVECTCDRVLRSIACWIVWSWSTIRSCVALRDLEQFSYLLCHHILSERPLHSLQTSADQKCNLSVTEFFFVGGGKRLHPLLPKHTNTPHHAHPSPPFSPSLLPSFPSPSPPLPLSSPLLLSSLSPLTPPPSSLSAVALNHHQACILFSSRSFLFWEIVKTSCRFWWDVQNLTFSWKFNLSTSGPELSERTRSSDHFLLRNHRKLIIRCGVMIFLVFSICDLYNVDSWFRDISTSCIHGVEISTPWVCMVQRHVSTLWIHIVNLHLCTTDSRC